MKWISREIYRTWNSAVLSSQCGKNNKNIKDKTKQNSVIAENKRAQLLPYNVKVGIYY